MNVFKLEAYNGQVAKMKSVLGQHRAQLADVLDMLPADPDALATMLAEPKIANSIRVILGNAADTLAGAEDTIDRSTEIIRRLIDAEVLRAAAADPNLGKPPVADGRGLRLVHDDQEEPPE